MKIRMPMDVPDWFEWREFGSLDNNASSDPDADGLLMRRGKTVRSECGN